MRFLPLYVNIPFPRVRSTKYEPLLFVTVLNDFVSPNTPLPVPTVFVPVGEVTP